MNRTVRRRCRMEAGFTLIEALVAIVVLSFGLSIALVTLATIVLNIIFHLSINGFNALVTIIVLTVIPGVIYLIRRYRPRKSEAPDGE